MIFINNKDFFGYDIEVSGSLVSINLMVEPQDFDLKSYRKTPFASIIIDNEKLAVEIERYDKKDRRKAINGTLELYCGAIAFNQYSLYTDEEYELYTSRFKDRRFHTLIYFFDSNVTYSEKAARYNKTILIGAYPLQGMISPIPKSVHYKLYNGCLISCKPFKWHSINKYIEPTDEGKDTIYNKLVYLLVEIKSVFRFDEFIRTSNDEIGVMKNYTWYRSMDYREDSRYPKTNIIDIPYNEAEDLFSKMDKNLFQLSDVPKDIMTKSDRISVKI